MSLERHFQSQGSGPADAPSLEDWIQAREDALDAMPSSSIGDQPQATGDYGAALAAVRTAEHPATLERQGDKITAGCTAAGITLKVAIDLGKLDPATTIEQMHGRRHAALDAFTASMRQAINAMLHQLDEIAAVAA